MFKEEGCLTTNFYFLVLCLYPCHCYEGFIPLQQTISSREDHFSRNTLSLISYWGKFILNIKENSLLMEDTSVS